MARRSGAKPPPAPPPGPRGVDRIAAFIWAVADDVLRDLYVRGKYRDVILPMTVIRRFDAVLEPTKKKVLARKERLDAAGIANQEDALRRAAGQAFYNTSPFTLRDLRARADSRRLRDDFVAYLDGFSANVRDILDNFEFRNQIPRLHRRDAIGTLIEKFLSPEINLGPEPVRSDDGSIRLPGLDNHQMGTVFEELVRRFGEETGEEAGEHWTPRDAVRLMANLVFLPVADRIRSGTYLLYDGACGTGGMLTVAEKTMRELAAARGKQVSTHLYGQEINAETYAICKADLLLKGEGAAADNVVGGPEHSTLSNDGFPDREFDFMLSNPPYGKSWKDDLARMGGKRGVLDPRFRIRHGGDPDYSLVTRSSDGQLLFLANLLGKRKRRTKLGSRIAEVHTAARCSPATPAPGRATSAAGSWRTTGSKPSSRCRSTCSTTPASPPMSGCWATGRSSGGGAGCSSLTRPAGAGRCGGISGRRPANSARRRSPASRRSSSPSRRRRSRASCRTRRSASAR